MQRRWKFFFILMCSLQLFWVGQLSAWAPFFWLRMIICPGNRGWDQTYNFNEIQYDKYKVGEALLFPVCSSVSTVTGLAEYAFSVVAISEKNLYKKFSVAECILLRNGKVVVSISNDLQTETFKEPSSKFFWPYYQSACDLFERKLWLSPRDRLSLRVTVILTTLENKDFLQTVTFPLKIITPMNREWNIPIHNR
jgi:hypothetical protein